MTPLRQKMIKAMELRNFAKNTQRGYLGAVKGLASYYRQSPDKLTKDGIEDYLLYLKNAKGNTTGSCGSVAAGLKFFCTHVIGTPIKVEHAKGGKEGYTVLSSRLLKELRQYYKTCKPSPYLFPSR